MSMKHFNGLQDVFVSKDFALDHYYSHIEFKPFFDTFCQLKKMFLFEEVKIIIWRVFVVPIQLLENCLQFKQRISFVTFRSTKKLLTDYLSDFIDQVLANLWKVGDFTCIWIKLSHQFKLCANSCVFTTISFFLATSFIPPADGGIVCALLPAIISCNYGYEIYSLFGFDYLLNYVF